MRTVDQRQSPARATVTFEDLDLVRQLYGDRDQQLKRLAREVGVDVHARGNAVTLSGEPEAVARAQRLLGELYTLLERGYPLGPNDVEYAVRLVNTPGAPSLQEVFLDTILVSARRRPVTPKSAAQKAYVDAIRTHDLVIGVGPAGTGKTYLAMAMAVAALTRKEVARIILTRPAVEAGERLGFLPGTLEEKVNPYLRPLYDALHDLLEFEKVARLMERGAIEVSPLAFMRGRTLNDSFIILDEAQNTTPEQMKMFLTRLGFSSKAVVTGDVTQIDLPPGARSGLVEAIALLRGVEGIAIVEFTERDVVRHRLVQAIVRAYERASRPAGGGEAAAAPAAGRPSAG
ncbi:MAG TPA: PhoH family protein, partial [Thermodesulfobacteriota bacterium]|nr:PhoH family protein [Thermodesulfobacteriota bacterium]